MPCWPDDYLARNGNDSWQHDGQKIPIVPVHLSFQKDSSAHEKCFYTSRSGLTLAPARSLSTENGPDPPKTSVVRQARYMRSTS